MLLWMGAAMVRRAPRLTLAADAGGGRLHPVAAGVVVSLANPYWTIWWCRWGAVRPGGAAARPRGRRGLLRRPHPFDLVWYSGSAPRGGRPPADDRPRLPRLIVACGALLLVFGACCLWKGAHDLR